MKIIADGKEIDVQQMALMFNERGRLIEGIFKALVELKDLAKQGQHEELAARVIKEHDLLERSVQLGEEGVPNRH